MMDFAAILFAVALFAFLYGKTEYIPSVDAFMTVKREVLVDGTERDVVETSWSEFQVLADARKEGLKIRMRSYFVGFICLSASMFIWLLHKI